MKETKGELLISTGTLLSNGMSVVVQLFEDESNIRTEVRTSEQKYKPNSDHVLYHSHTMSKPQPDKRLPISILIDELGKEEAEKMCNMLLSLNLKVVKGES